MSTPIKLKRKSYAMDVRTGQVVRVEEQGGTNYMVKTAYKSDGYWCERSDLTPVGDPHIWTGRQLIGFLVVLIIVGLTVYGAFSVLTDHGLDGTTALLYALPDGFLSWTILGYWTKLVRL